MQQYNIIKRITMYDVRGSIKVLETTLASLALPKIPKIIPYPKSSNQYIISVSLIKIE
mgnify:CR=1 FL=1